MGVTKWRQYAMGGSKALTKMLTWGNKGESENKKCWQGGGSEDQIHTDVI